jgi:hypothetical protein
MPVSSGYGMRLPQKLNVVFARRKDEAIFSQSIVLVFARRRYNDEAIFAQKILIKFGMAKLLHITSFLFFPWARPQQRRVDCLVFANTLPKNIRRLLE